MLNPSIRCVVVDSIALTLRFHVVTIPTQTPDIRNVEHVKFVPMSRGNMVGVGRWRDAAHVVAHGAKRPTLEDRAPESLPTRGFQSWFKFGPGRYLVERAARRSI
tara:strand:- start:5444 stop:5758 length:315 start_codon:yes stop_codon:yes gene_type:complete